MSQIKLDKSKLIVFFGSMNAMPMMYAVELRRLGYDVLYFVDVPRSEALSRPESHFPEISYPYPDWIVEWLLPSQILAALFPSVFAKLLEKKIRRIVGDKEVGCYVLNGFFISLGPKLAAEASKVSLTHGSDLDVWADLHGIQNLVKSFGNRSIFRFLPRSISSSLIEKVVRRQFEALQQSQTVLYFPRGLNTAGDRVLDQLISRGVGYVPRYDISYEPLKGQNREFKEPNGAFVVFAGVRFLFETFPDGNVGYSKANDVIIKGLAEYYKTNRNLIVHFVEKGEDVRAAKQLCKDTGLESAVVWHKEMPFKQLLNLYQIADVCFDQVGPHWIGAVGAYAMWLGKPLIANPASLIASKFWPKNTPVCAATTPAEVQSWMEKLEDRQIRLDISLDSRRFVEQHMGPMAALQQVFALPEKA